MSGVFSALFMKPGRTPDLPGERWFSRHERARNSLHRDSRRDEKIMNDDGGSRIDEFSSKSL
ncbi:MAG: hypothetical protein D6820_10765 [Lentisphaerae bacterium]|nr:MAG: hypothetical protein D6820_10765 [Lentisphaerota bacterium]